jgi:hypothetical protein
VIGDVITGAQAGASITGNAPSQTLNLVLPVNSISIGTVSSGTAASAVITGSSPSQVLSLVLPKGDTGAAGGVTSTIAGIAGASAVTNIVSLTQSSYDAISSKSSTTLYIING